MTTERSLPCIEHSADICVVGGGLAGMCAALAAARHGKRVVLMHDRPVFGGNCSSEIRMWPLGAQGSNRRETGIFEELILENMRVNPMRNFSIWDSVLYGAIRTQDGLDALMNCSVNRAEMDGDRITAVWGWQLTTYQWHRVSADIFIDCSGDSILAELSGAQYRVGREARAEFGEEAAPEVADSGTMGNSCMIQARGAHRSIPYIAPDWARKISDDELYNRLHRPELFGDNFWWLELGGTQDTLRDCEKIKDDLLALSFGAWDHIKNGGDHGADRWELDWAGFLPGKRESRRCIGDHLLTQPEVTAGGKFEDIIAYGGWKIDDHPPAGFDHRGSPNHNYECPSPFGIPYRCIYSINIENLMFAGRNISATHAAMASSRVMGTCAILGQAAGTAAALACEKQTTPRGVLPYIKELQEQLMDDDCWLPGLLRSISPLCQAAALSADEPISDIEHLRSGMDRPFGDEDNGCRIPLGTGVTYTLAAPATVREARLVFDSDLDRETLTGGIPMMSKHPTLCNRPADMEPYTFPTTMTDSFRILADGEPIAEITGNRQRLVRIPVGKAVRTLTFVPLATCGDETAHLFAFDFN